MNRKELSQNHWKYYLMLEKRFIESLEYVELHKDNFNTFSNGYALLIQAIGAELDVVFKEFCGFSTEERKNIADYAQHILTCTPEIKNQAISIQEYDIELRPFENWNGETAAKSLEWWNAFTSIKHNRYSQLKQANQKNVLYALGALYLMEMIYLREITSGTRDFDVFDESSALVTIKNCTSNAMSLIREVGVMDETEDYINSS